MGSLSSLQAFSHSVLTTRLRDGTHPHRVAATRHSPLLFFLSTKVVDEKELYVPNKHWLEVSWGMLLKETEMRSFPQCPLGGVVFPGQFGCHLYWVRWGEVGSKHLKMDDWWNRLLVVYV